jgi:hypothetical protein
LATHLSWRRRSGGDSRDSGRLASSIDPPQQQETQRR